MISELLQPRDDGYRYANADPVTGQAAWYDLRVRVRKADPAEDAESFPQFDPTAKPAGIKPAPVKLSYGADFRKGRSS